MEIVKSQESQATFTETKDVIVEYDSEGRKIINNYLFMSTIGKGSYAKVKLCVNIENGKKYAVKIINQSLLKKKKKGYGRGLDGYMTITYMLDDALNEIEILKRLNEHGGHKNVVRLFEILHDEEKEKIYLVMEYCSKGSIMDYNERTGVFSINKAYIKEEEKGHYMEEVLKGFLKDLAEGLEFSKKDKAKIFSTLEEYSP